MYNRTLHNKNVQDCVTFFGSTQTPHKLPEREFRTVPFCTMSLTDSSEENNSLKCFCFSLHSSSERSGPAIQLRYVSAGSHLKQSGFLFQSVRCMFHVLQCEISPVTREVLRLSMWPREMLACYIMHYQCAKNVFPAWAGREIWSGGEQSSFCCHCKL